MAGAPEIISPHEALRMCTQGALILDVREEYVNQYKQFGQVEVFQIPFVCLAKDSAQLPKDRMLIVADTSGVQSGAAMALLKEMGFSLLAVLAGGFLEWERDGLPVIVNRGERLTGSCACQLRARDGSNEKGMKG